MGPDINAKFREATPADIATIAKFNVAMAHETEDKLLDPVIVTRGVTEALKRPEVCRYYVAEMDGRVVACFMITYEWSDWRCGIFWWVQSVYVDPAFRRRGVFRELHKYVEDKARATKDVIGLRLYVEMDNTPARATYERLGMKQTGYEVYEIDWSGRAG
jgi:GNAT superfamily N-acetyltransferase